MVVPVMKLDIYGVKQNCYMIDPPGVFPIMEILVGAFSGSNHLFGGL